MQGGGRVAWAAGVGGHSRLDALFSTPDANGRHIALADNAAIFRVGPSADQSRWPQQPPATRGPAPRGRDYPTGRSYLGIVRAPPEKEPPPTPAPSWPMPAARLPKARMIDRAAIDSVPASAVALILAFLHPDRLAVSRSACCRSASAPRSASSIRSTAWSGGGSPGPWHSPKGRAGARIPRPARPGARSRSTLGWGRPSRSPASRRPCPTPTGYCLGCRLYFLRCSPDLVTRIWTRGRGGPNRSLAPIRYSSPDAPGPRGRPGAIRPIPPMPSIGINTTSASERPKSSIKPAPRHEPVLRPSNLRRLTPSRSGRIARRLGDPVEKHR